MENKFNQNENEENENIEIEENVELNNLKEDKKEEDIEEENEEKEEERDELIPKIPIHFTPYNFFWKYGPSYYIELVLQKFFYRIGHCVATAPVLVIMFALLCSLLLSVGVINIYFETNPQKLWVPDDSTTVKEKNFFDKSFTPFFRIEQIIIMKKDQKTRKLENKSKILSFFEKTKNKFFSKKKNEENSMVVRSEGETSDHIPVVNKTMGYKNVITKEILEEVYQLQKEIRNIKIKSTRNESITLTMDDLCYSMPKKGCIIQSPVEFYQMDLQKIKDDKDPGKKLLDCVTTKGLYKECMSKIGIPLYYKQVMGGPQILDYDYGAPTPEIKHNRTLEARSLVVTYLFLDGETSKDAELWEKQFIEICQKKRKHFKISFSAQRSVQDELKSDTGDIITIGLSYVAMFVYVAISLGSLHPIRSRIFLAFFGIVIVVLSVLISGGICVTFGIKATLIISEVIPFLILAIGVDNMFIIVNHSSKMNKKLSVPERIGQTLGKVGTSMALASLSEFVAFMLGSLTGMPAVQAFCLFAGIAVLANFILQITAFTALLSIDMRRQDQDRLEFDPMIKLPIINKREWFNFSKIIRWFMENYYSKILLSDPIRITVIFGFLLLTALMAYLSMFLKQGLDQATALKTDSYVVDYFVKQRTEVDLGPPVYFVTQKDLDYSSIEGQNTLNKLMDSVIRTKYIDKNSVYFWLETFKKWAFTAGTGKGCIKKALKGENIPPEKFVPLLKEFLSKDECCFIRGTQTSFCGFQYVHDVNIVNDTILSTRVWAQTTPLVAQSDFINSMKSAYYTASQFKEKIFPYSIYYIFFAQYLYLPSVAAFNISIACIAVFCTTLLLLASPVSAIYILLMLVLIDIDLLAIMALFDIYVNALSVVNLVMSIGISVEFCVHLTKAFLRAEGTHKERAKKSLVEMGSSVTSGILFTKFIGVCVLSFSQSAIFRIYYFKMYLAIVILGGLHGLILLPVLLSFVGPSSVKKIKKNDEKEV